VRTFNLFYAKLKNVAKKRKAKDVLLCVLQGTLAAEERECKEGNWGDKVTSCLRGLQYVYE
jgi:hypothetical protein